jgi:cation transport ATPase
MVGIVWMTLVPEENRIRMFLEQPMWAGSVARAVWALFFLSTPVMFCVADVFHKRALHEIRVLWRKGSSVSVLRRFYRFGSMNLLICLGVSISYFASVALLALDAVTVDKGKKKPSTVGGHDHDGMMGGMDTMGGMDEEPMPKMHMATYFDSTVFLTMFLLIGG